ncbi:hypothetical protein HispidOSU_022575, partial [Sigmodon hispidus]
QRCLMKLGGSEEEVSPEDESQSTLPNIMIKKGKFHLDQDQKLLLILVKLKKFFIEYEEDSLLDPS